MRARFPVLAALLPLALVAALPPAAGAQLENPCQAPLARHLRCPNLRI